MMINFPVQKKNGVNSTETPENQPELMKKVLHRPAWQNI
jgi:hypothetical protein